VRIRLIALDLDGTLMEPGENEIHPMVRDTIRRTVKSGVTVTLATGRPYSFTRPVAAELGLTAPLICYQGGVIQETDGRVLRNTTFEIRALTPVLELARQRNWQHYLESDSALYLMVGLDYDEELFSILSLPAHWMAEPANLASDLPPTNQVGIYLPEGATEAHVADLRDAAGATATVFRTHSKFITIIPAGVSKAKALAWLAKRMDIPQPAVMAVGDSDNDAGMVRWAGLGVAMGNARPSVLEAADWVAPPIGEAGAAVALERWVLGRQEPAGGNDSE
jgi:hypothetical protein